MPIVRSPPLRQCYKPTLATMFPFTSYTINKGINVMQIFLAPTYQNHRHLAKEIPQNQECPRMSKIVQECPRLKRGYKNSCSYLIKTVILVP